MNDIEGICSVLAYSWDLKLFFYGSKLDLMRGALGMTCRISVTDILELKSHWAPCTMILVCNF